MYYPIFLHLHEKQNKISQHKRLSDNIAQIVDTKCSITGCHNTQSKDGAAGLDMSTWEKLMLGAKMGAVVIPYFHKQSSVFLFCNTDTTLGVTATPTMPYNQSPLSRDEVITLRDWIDNGAPNKDGFVKFSDNPQRSKIYILNQGCDLVAVVDEESKLIMRYIPVGNQPGIESPHRVGVSSDGSFWCVSFLGGTVLQKFSTATDKLLGEVEIGSGSWNTFAITHDGTKAYCVDWNSNGNVKCVDLVNYTVLWSAGGLFYPHGSALSTDENFLYLTAAGNFIYKINLTTFDQQQIIVDTSSAAIISQIYAMHEIIFTPDRSKYFLTCQITNEVRVMNAANDSLLSVIPVGVYPQEMAICTTTSNLFVTCINDNATFSPNIGSVYVIDYNSLTVVKSLFRGWQPHGIAIDEQKKLVYAINRNANPSGPAPPHTTDCGGRDGYVTLIDLNTLKMVPNFKTELSVDPYSAAFR